MPYPVSVLRYGSTRQLDVSAVSQVIEQLIPRICIALPNACTGIDEDVSQDVFQKVLNTNRAINVLQNKEYISLWDAILMQISTMQNVNGVLNGACTRILFDKNTYKVKHVAQLMHYALSQGNTVPNAAYWIEGFLHGSGLLLIHNPDLWQVLDNWVEDMDMDVLTEVLPLLRRTFSKFSESERQKMMTMAQQEKTTLSIVSSDKYLDFDKERGEKVLDTLRLLLK